MAHTHETSLSAADTSLRSGPTHEQIAQRAHELWARKGYPSGQDEQNWYEAEQQLTAELTTVTGTSPAAENLGDANGFEAQETTHQDTNAPFTETAPLSRKVERELKGFGRPAGRSVTSVNL